MVSPSCALSPHMGEAQNDALGLEERLTAYYRLVFSRFRGDHYAERLKNP